MQSGPSQKTKKKEDRLAARLTRGSQPARRRVNGKRFSKDNQPKRVRGRPKGATNLMTRQVQEAILIAFSELGEDLHGKGGLVGFLKRIGRNDLKTAGMLLRAVMPTQMTVERKENVSYQSIDEVRAELNRSGISIEKVFELEYIKPPVVEVEATDVTDDGKKAHDPLKHDKRP
jgi:hypothetical protein